MSRSTRKTPRVHPGGATSERWVRAQAARLYRRTIRTLLRRVDGDVVLPRQLHHADRDIGRSGRQYFDPRRWPKLMRK